MGSGWLADEVSLAGVLDRLCTVTMIIFVSPGGKANLIAPPKSRFPID